MAEEKDWNLNESNNLDRTVNDDNNKSLPQEDVYIRQNGEDISDPAIIQICKKEQNRDIIDNYRLGSYDKFGNYIIIPEIKFELINMPKLIVKTKIKPEYELYEVVGDIPLFNSLYFKLIITKNDVTLFIVENVDREAGEYVEVYEEIIDHFSIKGEDIPTSVILKSYHIYSDEGAYREFVNRNIDVKNILTRKVYLTLLSREINKKAIFDEKFAYHYMLDILKESGEYGQKVLNDFSNRIRDRQSVFEITDPNKYYKAVNEILLSSVDFVTTKEDKQNKQTSEIYHNLLDARNVNIDKYIKETSQDIDRTFVSNVVDKAINKEYEKNFHKDLEETAKVNEEEEEVILEFNDILSKKSNKKVVRKLEKPILKQRLNKENSKEQESAKIDKKEKDSDKEKEQPKKESSTKKVVPAKVSKNANKKTVVKKTVAKNKKSNAKSKPKKEPNKEAKKDKDNSKDKKKDKDKDKKKDKGKNNTKKEVKKKETQEVEEEKSSIVELLKAFISVNIVSDFLKKSRKQTNNPITQLEKGGNNLSISQNIEKQDYKLMQPRRQTRNSQTQLEKGENRSLTSQDVKKQDKELGQSPNNEDNQNSKKTPETFEMFEIPDNAINRDSKTNVIPNPSNEKLEDLGKSIDR